MIFDKFINISLCISFGFTLLIFSLVGYSVLLLFGIVGVILYVLGGVGFILFGLYIVGLFDKDQQITEDSKQ